jgi:hypothetical protein
VIPKEIEEKLSHWEEEYFKKHSAALKTYMSKVLVDLTVVNSPSLFSFPFLSQICAFIPSHIRKVPTYVINLCLHDLLSVIKPCAVNLALVAYHFQRNHVDADLVMLMPLRNVKHLCRKL